MVDFPDMLLEGIQYILSLDCLLYLGCLHPADSKWSRSKFTTVTYSSTLVLINAVAPVSLTVFTCVILTCEILWIGGAGTPNSKGDQFLQSHMVPKNDHPLKGRSIISTAFHVFSGIFKQYHLVSHTKQLGGSLKLLDFVHPWFCDLANYISPNVEGVKLRFLMGKSSIFAFFPASDPCQPQGPRCPGCQLSRSLWPNGPAQWSPVAFEGRPYLGLAIAGDSFLGNTQGAKILGPRVPIFGVY